MVFILLVLTGLGLDEFYPFSEFPMYSDPDPGTTDFIYLGDADQISEDGKPAPIPMQTMIGIRPAKATKIFRTAQDEKAKILDIARDQLPDAALHAVALECLRYFRAREEHMQTADQLPSRLCLVRVEIDLVLGEGVSEVHTILASENPTGEETP